MSQAIVAIKSARAYLNDVNGISWPDNILIPLLQEAFGELIQDLDLNQIGVLKYKTAPILVPAGTLTLPSQPANILEPVYMIERTPGTTADFFSEMTKVNFLPDVDQDNNLLFWCWSQETIQFVGAVQDREVILHYRGFPTTPQLLSDQLGITYAERYLGPRIAALAYDSIGKNSKRLSEIAELAKYKIVQRGVLSEQTPVRRRSYRSTKGFFRGVTAPISVGGSSGGGSVTTYPVTSTGVLAVNFGANLLTNTGQPPAGLYDIMVYVAAAIEGTGDVTITISWNNGISAQSSSFTYSLGDATAPNSTTIPIYTDGAHPVSVSIVYNPTGSYSAWFRLSQ